MPFGCPATWEFQRKLGRLPLGARPYSYIADVTKIDDTIRLMHKKNLSADEMAFEFNKFLTNRYREAASNNRTLNIKKSSLFVRTISWLWSSVVFLFISIGLFVLCSVNATEPLSKTHIHVDPNKPFPIEVISKGD